MGEERRSLLGQRACPAIPFQLDPPTAGPLPRGVVGVLALEVGAARLVPVAREASPMGVEGADLVATDEEEEGIWYVIGFHTSTCRNNSEAWTSIPLVQCISAGEDHHQA